MSNQIWLGDRVDVKSERVTDALLVSAREDWPAGYCNVTKHTSRWTVTFAHDEEYCFDLWQIDPKRLGTSISVFMWMYWAQLRVCYALAYRTGLLISFEDSEVGETATSITEDDLARVASFRDLVKRRMFKYKGRPEYADDFWEELFVGAPPEWDGAPREIHTIQDDVAYEAALTTYKAAHAHIRVSRTVADHAQE